MGNTYWAASPRDKIGAEITSKVEKYKKHLEKSGRLGTLRKAYKKFYGNPYIENVDQSLQAIEVNHFANLVRHIHVMVTSQRPAWETSAINTDLESIADTQLASGLLDYYMREKGLERKFIDAVKKALFLKEGWISVNWNVLGGQVHGKDPETGLVIHEGDIEYKCHLITDVARDFRKTNMNHKWLVITELENKFDIAAKYNRDGKNQALYDKIISISEKIDPEFELTSENVGEEESSDEIKIHTLFHERTEAMPEGRMTIVTGKDIVLFDGPLPYKRINIFPITSEEHYETAFGHSQAHDLLPLCDAFDATISAILTNQAANAVQNFAVPKGASPKVTMLENGMNLVEYDPKYGKIEPMQLLQTAPEVFNFGEFLSKNLELLSGVNQIARGNAPATLSGAAMALIQQQAIQFMNGIQLSYSLMQELVGTATVEMLQTFAVVPRVAMIAGKTKKSMMRKFKGTDLNGIGRVIVNTANPLTKTAAGRVEIANQLVQRPDWIQNPQQYIEVLTTGNLEPLYENERSKLNQIRSENEWLMEGKDVQVLMTDDDAIHVLEHSSVVSSPEARLNPQVVRATLEHIQEHINQASTKSPILAAMLKQQSFAAPPMPMPPQGAPEGAAAPVMDNTNPITQQAEQVQMPEPALPPQI